MTVTGFGLWIGYGLLISRWPLIAANSVRLLMSGAVLARKWRFTGSKGRR